MWCSENLNSSTINELGSWCVKGWCGRAAIRYEEGTVSMATLQVATTKGTVTLNPVSGILTRPDTYQREGGAGKRLENRESKMTFHTGQQASKCKANHEAPPAESSKVAPEQR